MKVVYKIEGLRSIMTKFQLYSFRGSAVIGFLMIVPSSKLKRQFIQNQNIY